MVRSLRNALTNTKTGEVITPLVPYVTCIVSANVEAGLVVPRFLLL